MVFNRLNKFYSLFLVLLLHLLMGFFAFFFANSESAETHNSDSKNKIVIFSDLAYAKLLQENLVQFKIKNYQNINLVKSNPQKDEASFDEFIKAHAVVLLMASPANDANDNNQNLINKIPSSVTVYFVSMPPVDNQIYTRISNAEIVKFNQYNKILCSAKNNCNFIDLTNLLADKNGNLKTIYHYDDGVRLNQNGFQIINNALNSTIP